MKHSKHFIQQRTRDDIDKYKRLVLELENIYSSKNCVMCAKDAFCVSDTTTEHRGLLKKTKRLKARIANNTIQA